MSEEYQKFLSTKGLKVESVGFDVELIQINPTLFPFLRDFVRWSVRKGRCAIFADTGLGKTFMQLEWARIVAEETGGFILIVAPLSVARQTKAEAAKLGIHVEQVRRHSDIDRILEGYKDSEGEFDYYPPRIFATNYEMAHHFDAGFFSGVVLDESSILKSESSKTRARLIAQWGETPYRLACTATPAPNDISELANHAEFLGVMTRQEMLAAFFVHKQRVGKQQGWVMKGHAKDAFYQWLASWGISIKKPSDIGYSDDGYELPPLSIIPHIIDTGWVNDGCLFAMPLKGIRERATVRKDTLSARVGKVVEIVKGVDGKVIVWCWLYEEADALMASIPGAVEVRGNMDPERKVAVLERFLDGDARILVTKPSIAGFGLNMQVCSVQVFCGITDSHEIQYQAIRRSYRFGQENPVDIHIVTSEAERCILDNVRRKEKEADEMSRELVAHVANFSKSEIMGLSTKKDEYQEDDVRSEMLTALLGDSCERLRELKDDSVGLSVYSPPFAQLYTYSATERDLGNSKNIKEFFIHYRFIIDELLRVTMPGRLTAVHCSQIATTKVNDGHVGMVDFRGDLIREYTARGWIYVGEATVDKDPQAQAIRAKVHGLMFVTLEKDSTNVRPAMADYLLLFRKPGENKEPVKTDVSREEWIQWARPVWYNIKETDVLSTRAGKDERDEKHICPLQLGFIRRVVRLYSNKGDLVVSPFMGIGSEGSVAIKLGRRFWGCELKPSYFRAAVNNLKAAESSGDQGMLL